MRIDRCMRVSEVLKAREPAVPPAAGELGAMLTLSEPMHDRLIGRYARMPKVTQSLSRSRSQKRDNSDTWAPPQALVVPKFAKWQRCRSALGVPHLRWELLTAALCP